MAAQELQIQLKTMNYLIDYNLEVKSSKEEEASFCYPLSNSTTPLLRYKTALSPSSLPERDVMLGRIR